MKERRGWFTNVDFPAIVKTELRVHVQRLEQSKDKEKERGKVATMKKIINGKS
jgi:hypothetical protein